MLEKLSLFNLNGGITGDIDVKMNGSNLDGKSCFKLRRLSFNCKLGWDSYIGFIAKTGSRKIVALNRSEKFLSSEVAHYFFKSTIDHAIIVSSCLCWSLLLPGYV